MNVVNVLNDLNRRSFLKWTTAVGLPIVAGNSIADADCGDGFERSRHRGRSVIPVGVDLESLRQEIEDTPATLVDRAVESGWRVVCDETVLKRPEAWQQELARALARHRIELAAIEAVVDLGRVTFASDSPIARRGVIGRLDRAIRQARRLRCRHLLVVPGLRPAGELTGVVQARVVMLLQQCRDRARAAGMRIVLDQIDRRSDQVQVVQVVQVVQKEV